MNMRIVLCLIFCLAFAGCEGSGGSAEKVKPGVVDLGRLMRESAPGKDGMKFIEEQQKNMQTQLDALQDKLEKNPKDEAAMQELQRLYTVSQQQIQAEGQNIAAQILEVVQRALDDYRAKNGFEIIFLTEALASYNPKLDVTDAVLETLSKQKIDFKALNSEAQKPAAAPRESAPQNSGQTGK